MGAVSRTGNTRGRFFCVVFSPSGVEFTSGSSGGEEQYRIYHVMLGVLTVKSYLRMKTIKILSGRTGARHLETGSCLVLVPGTWEKGVDWEPFGALPAWVFLALAGTSRS